MKIIATRKNELGMNFIVEKYNNYYFANLNFSNSEIDIIDYRVILTIENVKYCIKNDGFQLTSFAPKEIN